MTVQIELTIGERLQIARKRAGLDQGALAEAVGLARPTVSEYERGRAGAMSAEKLIAWAQLCGVSLNWLAWGSEETPAFGTGALDGVARPKGLEPLTFCSVADDELALELAFYAIVERVDA